MGAVIVSPLKPNPPPATARPPPNHQELPLRHSSYSFGHLTDQPQPKAGQSTDWAKSHT